MLAFPPTLGWQPPCEGKADPRIGCYQAVSCKKMLNSHFKKSSWCFFYFCFTLQAERDLKVISTFLSSLVYSLMYFLPSFLLSLHFLCFSLFHLSIRGTKFILVPHKIRSILTIGKHIPVLATKIFETYYKLRNQNKPTTQARNIEDVTMIKTWSKVLFQSSFSFPGVSSSL